MSKQVAIFVIFVLTSTILVTPSFVQGENVCSPAQKAQAQNVLSSLQEFGSREVVGSGVWYDWYEGWYSLDFETQRKMMRTIADTEYCVSDGTIIHMHINYNGEDVAEATPSGGIRVLKSKP